MLSRTLIVLAYLAMLGGCSSGMINIPSTEVIDSSGKIITKTASTIGDTSAYRTHQKYNSWNIAFNGYYDAWKSSGVQITSYSKVKLEDGSSAYLPNMTIRREPVFVAPADLKDHPVWGVINNTVNKVTPWGFGTLAATSIIDGFRQAAMQPSYSFAGPANIQGSMNTVGGAQTILTKQQRMGSADSMAGRVTGLDDAGNYMGIPGCSSEESYLAGRCEVLP